MKFFAVLAVLSVAASASATGIATLGLASPTWGLGAPLAAAPLGLGLGGKTLIGGPIATSITTRSLGVPAISTLGVPAVSTLGLAAPAWGLGAPLAAAPLAAPLGLGLSSKTLIGAPLATSITTRSIGVPAISTLGSPLIAGSLLGGPAISTLGSPLIGSSLIGAPAISTLGLAKGGLLLKK